mmetsp:Transcript_48114/g.114509  ORF Transcript_48114/g.114509 Transcript_48114/m.114509 type:complete len:237 (-) Transcript_48114:487-1197(-)
MWVPGIATRRLSSGRSGSLHEVACCSGCRPLDRRELLLKILHHELRSSEKLLDMLLLAPRPEHRVHARTRVEHRHFVRGRDAPVQLDLGHGRVPLLELVVKLAHPLDLFNVHAHKPEDIEHEKPPVVDAEERRAVGVRRAPRDADARPWDLPALDFLQLWRNRQRGTLVGGILVAEEVREHREDVARPGGRGEGGRVDPALRRPHVRQRDALEADAHQLQPRRAAARRVAAAGAAR